MPWMVIAWRDSNVYTKPGQKIRCPLITTKIKYLNGVCRGRFSNQAVVLSVDEIMLSLVGLYAGEKHDEYTERLQNYLFRKSAEIVETGMSVILDWGFWTREKMKQAREFFFRAGISTARSITWTSAIPCGENGSRGEIVWYPPEK